MYFVAKHHALAVALHELAEERFAGAVRVDIGGVDEIAPGLAESVVDFCASSFAAPHPQSSPKVIVPSAASETRSPQCPGSLYFITFLSGVCLLSISGSLHTKPSRLRYRSQAPGNAAVGRDFRTGFGAVCLRRTGFVFSFFLLSPCFIREHCQNRDRMRPKHLYYRLNRSEVSLWNCDT